MFYLASKSPRRRQLLEAVGLEFSLLAPEVAERMDESESPREAAERLACQKAAAGSRIVRAHGLPAHPVVAADTIVTIDDEAMGKPRDAEQAFAMLERLSGRTHRVVSAVALDDGEAVHRRTSETLVTMKTLERWEIQKYWESGEPEDKAGAYAIQGLGSAFVVRLEGSYSGVVGLPMFETRELLATVGIDWL